ncbi:hypothetical protein Acav_0711 [Paracidovorax avenae ATCC 19860]|uniref:Uncharacterized protein n=2 Tax=Paracidovorax avenae TaxID=80867 RepID=F0Q7V0_PARA1|nr:hypothetical protein Acav_0711 [Paracidovorax avenae ATCC 19860]
MLYQWIKIYPLVSLLLFFLAFSAGMRNGLHGWLTFLILILISAVCFLLEGFFYGALQVLALILGGYYYYRLGRNKVSLHKG